ncbi:582_t:CDS:2, partial [Acaulospora colombiana]
NVLEQDLLQVGEDIDKKQDHLRTLCKQYQELAISTSLVMAPESPKYPVMILWIVVFMRGIKSTVAEGTLCEERGICPAIELFRHQYATPEMSTTPSDLLSKLQGIIEGMGDS